jgi:hypothetical protein
VTEIISTTPKPTLHLKGHGDLPFALQFGDATKPGGTIPFLISWSSIPGEVALFGLFVPSETISTLHADDSHDREFMTWLEALRDSTLVTRDRHPAGLRVMAIDIAPALEEISPADVLAAAEVLFAELATNAGEIALTVELFRVEQRSPLRLSIMDRPLAEAWGSHYQFAAGLQLLADRRPIPGTAYMAPAVYGKSLHG